jgi:hypothetical protein
MQKPVHTNRNVNDHYSDDDLGVDFLANTSRTSKSNPETPMPQPMMGNANFSSLSGAPAPQIQYPFPQQNQHPTVNLNKMPDFGSQPTRNFSGPPSEHSQSDSFDDSVSEMSEQGMSQEDIIKEKRTLLFKLKRYERKGYKLSRTYSLNSTLEDLRSEYESIRREANLEQGLKVSKNLLISSCSLLEYLNNRFDPMDIVLDGWSEEVHEDVEDNVYDEVLEELYYKYYDKVSLGPEIKLLTMLGGSAMKFHMTQTLLKTMVPDAETLLKQNPNLKNEIAALVNKNVPGINDLNSQVNNMMFNDQVTGLGPHVKPNRGGNLGVPKREMQQPSDVDQILRDIEKDADSQSNVSSETRRRRKANVLEMHI